MTHRMGQLPAAHLRGQAKPKARGSPGPRVRRSALQTLKHAPDVIRLTGFRHRAFFTFPKGRSGHLHRCGPFFHVFRPRRTHCALMIAFEETRPFRSTENACPSERLGSAVLASPRSPQRFSSDSLNECPFPFEASTCNKSSASVLYRPEISLFGCHHQKNLLQTHNSTERYGNFSRPCLTP